MIALMASIAVIILISVINLIVVQVIDVRLGYAASKKAFE